MVSKTDLYNMIIPLIVMVYSLKIIFIFIDPEVPVNAAKSRHELTALDQ